MGMLPVALLLSLSLFLQEPVPLGVDAPVSGVIDAQSESVQTPTLDAAAAAGPVVGNEHLLVVTESGTYTIELRSHDFDAYLVLLEESGTPIAEDDDGLIGSQSRLVVEIEAGEKYRVQACALGGAQGAYELHLLVGPPAPATQQSLMLAKEADLVERLRHIERTFGKQTEEYAKFQNRLGVHYFRHGLYQKAQQEWEGALSIREQVLGPNDQSVATSLNNVAMLHRTLGNFAEARSLFERALSIVEANLGEGHPGTVGSLHNLAGVLQYQGEYAKAVQMYERALAISEGKLGPEHPTTAAVLGDLGYVYDALGNFEKAQPLYERALAIRESQLGPNHQMTAAALNNLGVLHDRQGRFEVAFPLLERALAIREQELGLNHPETALTLQNLAGVMSDQGQQVEALSLYRRGLAVWEDALGPEHPHIAQSLSNIGGILVRQDEYEEALLLYQRSLDIKRKVYGDKHYETAHGLHSLGNLFLALGEPAQALPLFEQALAILKEVRGPFHPSTAQTLNNMAILYDAQEDYEQALPLFEQALAIRESLFGIENPQTVVSLENLGDLFMVQGNTDLALDKFHKALTSTLAYLDRELPSMTESGRLQFLELSANPEKLISCLVQGSSTDLAKYFATYQDWKGKATRLQAASVKLGQLNATSSIRDNKGEIQQLARELSEMVLLPLADQAEDHVQRIRALRRERLQLERELNRELGIDLVLETPSFEEVQVRLPSDAVLLDFFVGEDVYAWVVKSTGQPRLIHLGASAELRKSQEAFLNSSALRGGRMLLKSNPDPGAEYLALLWKPLHEAVAGAQTVVVSPDGFLCELPFGILQTGKDQYLLEQYRFLYLPDPTGLSAPKATGQAREGSMFVVGGVNYFRRNDAAGAVSPGPSTRSRVSDSWSSLPATRNEIQSLRDLHDFVLEWETPLTVVEGKSATEERIRAELPGKRYVHIATHAYFEPDHLPSLLTDAAEQREKIQLGEQIQAVGLLPCLLSGLVFAGVNGDPDPTRDDGYLSAEEIQHLDLSACDLVVLSACETALGSARAGEGLMSLRRSFSVAGADTVISSLWKVDDKATAQLMKDFYTNLWEKNMSRGDALHEAKLRMLRRNRIDNGGDAKPSTWGAFVLSGAWN